MIYLKPEEMIELLMEQRDALLFGVWTHMGSPLQPGEACAVRYVKTNSEVNSGLCTDEPTRCYTDEIARELYGKQLLDLNYSPETSREDLLSVYDEAIRRLKAVDREQG